MKSYTQKASEVERNWHLVDVKGQVLGRVATEIAQKLIGKHKPTYSPNLDGGDYVVVINAQEIVTTGNKDTQKKYRSHSGYPGGLRERTLGELKATFPTRVIEKAVYNMLPKNRLRQHRMTRLKVYAGNQHQHQSQLGTAQGSQE